MADEYSKDQTAQLVFNAEIKKDIGFIRDSMNTINENLKVYAAQFMPRTEAMAWKSEQEDHNRDMEKRVRFLERYVWSALGVLAAIEFITKLLPLIHISST